MAVNIETYLFCLDDHRSFSEDVKKRFSDISRYIVSIAHNREEFIRNLENERDHNFCKVAIIGLHESKENFEMADHLISDIKKIDSSTGIILLAPPEKIDELKKAARFNVDSYVARNTNTVLRIHNTVKKLISEHSLLLYRRKRTVSLYILMIFIILSLIFVAVARFKLQMYF
jgi:DNA-binding NarL/FixJ family response regulator